MRRFSGRGCDAHQDVLLAVAGRIGGSPDDAVRQAYDHVTACRRCESDLRSTTLVVFGLQGIGQDARRRQPDADAWLRLSDRLRRPQAARPWRESLAGSALAIAIVAAVGLPLLSGSLAGSHVAPAASVAPATAPGERASVPEAIRTYDPPARGNVTAATIVAAWNAADSAAPGLPGPVRMVSFAPIATDRADHGPAEAALAAPHATGPSSITRLAE